MASLGSWSALAIHLRNEDANDGGQGADSGTQLGIDFYNVRANLPNLSGDFFDVHTHLVDAPTEAFIDFLDSAAKTFAVHLT